MRLSTSRYLSCLLLFCALWHFGEGVAAGDLVPPQGLIGSIDDSGGICVEWVYSGLRDTTYQVSSGGLLRAAYISREPGAHQLACRFMLSDDRQWIVGSSIWVQKGLSYSDASWFGNSLLRVSICPDNQGRPGAPLLRPLEYRPAELGIPPSGGYLDLEFDQAAPDSPVPAVWVLIEWPVDTPDLVCVGIDDQPPLFEAMYLDASQEDQDWMFWTDHNPLVSLRSLCYAGGCFPDGESDQIPTGSGSADEIAESFVIERAARYDEVPVCSESWKTAIPGDQTSFYDSEVYADYVYEYHIRAATGEDSSETALLEIIHSSPFNCDWVVPETSSGDPQEPVQLLFKFVNVDELPLSAIFRGGFLKPGSSECPIWTPNTPDSLPLTAEIGELRVPTGQIGIFQLYAEEREIEPGSYGWTAIFEVNDLGTETVKYKLHGTLEVSESVAVIDESTPDSVETATLRVFPNPGIGGVWIEIHPAESARFAGGEGGMSAGLIGSNYLITVYNILGREVARLEAGDTPPTGEVMTLRFDCRDKNGNPLPSALYFIKVQAERWSTCRKFILLR